jgi:hypothetical protein
MTDLLVSGPERGPAVVPRPVVAGPWAVVPDLARRHAVRMVRHPVLLLGVLWYVLIVGVPHLPRTPYDQYSMVTGMVAFGVGPLAFFAANLVASAGRRSDADDWTPSLPLPALHRTWALLLACLAPAALVAVLDLVVIIAIKADGGPIFPVQWQHLATVPVTVLGAAVLGVAVARLLPWLGMPLLVAVGLVVFNFWVSERGAYLGFYVDFAVWTRNDVIPAMTPGSPGWHLLYLAALVGMAACGALLRDARRWWAPVLTGAALGVVVLVAGAAQLP